MRRVIFENRQCPGDQTMLTATVRDLDVAHPRQFQIDVRTSCPAIWENNPRITRLSEAERGVEVIPMHYPLVHESNQRPFHFVHGFTQFAEKQLGVAIPVTQFHGEIFLTDEERWSPLPGHDLPDRFWIVVAGGKYDFTAKWWNPANYQKVVDHYRNKIAFVQCGEAGHWHPPLEGVINLVGKTSLREFIRLMHHAEGVVCPVTFAMHLAPAVETRAGRPKVRPCVVIAGGREPPHWEAYPQHQYISTVGALSCCLEGGCWKSRCQKVGDGDEKDRRNLCEQPVQITPDLWIPRCLEMITPADVIRRIDLYLEGGALSGERQPVVMPANRPAKQEPPNTNAVVKLHARPTPKTVVHPKPKLPVAKRPYRVLLEFRHGLGDSVQLTIVLLHLRHYHPDWEVDLAALHGKHTVGRELCRNQLILGESRTTYDKIISLDWDECREAHAEWPSTKPTQCLLHVLRLTPRLELFGYQIVHSKEADQRARDYLATLCPNGPRPDGRFPAVLLHYQGNTSCDRKDLTHETARHVCQSVRELGYVPVILDWDNRSPLIDQKTIFNPGPGHALWGGHGTGDAETLAALIEASSLMIGVDSGPLHVAGATSTPALGVWTRHHPVHYFDLCPNVRHLVPGNHRTLTKGPAAAEFFEGHYSFDVYTDLNRDLVTRVHHQLGGEPIPPVSPPEAKTISTPRILTSVTYDQQYYEEHQQAGLDYLNFGDWQREYGRWFVESLGLRNRRLLDVGCACGSILRGLGEAGAIVSGFDLSEYMIHLGRKKWPDMAPLLHVADAADLTCFGNSSWQALHSNQVAEHWSPESVPKILKELARITAPGGLFFCALDTEEMFCRQGRNTETEDPTHLCIRPKAWWLEQFAAAGWQDRTSEYEPALKGHPLSFLKRYDWDYFVLRKEPASFPVPPYDLAKYPNIWDWAGASIDQRHLFWMYDILLAGHFQHALEIGCLNGASSTAFVEAINAGRLQKATFCDIELRPSVKSVLAPCRFSDRVKTFEGRSVDLLKQSDPFDFVFVDGDHRLASMPEELDLLLKRKPMCVMAHDTNALAVGYRECDGPPLLKWAFQTTAPYLCLEDNAPRPGEDTYRGLFFATTSPDLFEAARESLKKWGAISHQETN